MEALSGCSGVEQEDSFVCGLLQPTAPWLWLAAPPFGPWNGRQMTCPALQACWWIALACQTGPPGCSAPGASTRSGPSVDFCFYRYSIRLSAFFHFHVHIHSLTDRSSLPLRAPFGAAPCFLQSSPAASNFHFFPLRPPFLNNSGQHTPHSTLF